MGRRLSGCGLLCLAPIALLASGACWGETGGAGDKTIVRVVLWGYGFPGEMELYQDAVASFNREHRQVEARLSVQGWPEAYGSVRNWLTKTEEAAYVVLVRDDWLPEFAPALVPLEDLLAPAEFDEYYAAALDRCRHGGRTYGFPWVVRTRALYYRTDLLRRAGLKPPQTWDELIAVAEKISSPPDVYGFGLPAAGAPASAAEESAELFLLLLWAHGGTLVQPDGKWAMGPEALRTLEFYSRLSIVQHGTQPAAVTWSHGDVQSLFAIGRLGMVIADHTLADFLHRTTRLRDLPYDIAPLPGGEQAVALVSTDMLALSAGSRRPDLGLALLRHLTRDSFLAALGEAAGLPAKRAVAERAASRKMRPFLAGLKAARGKPLAIWPEARSAILQVTYDVLTGRKLPEEAVRGLALQGVPVTLPPEPEGSARE